LKTEGIAFNEIEVYQTTLAPFKISDQEKFDGIMFLVHLQLTFDKQQNQNEICFCVGATTKSIRVKENKNIVIEIPTIEDVIVEVIEYYNTEEVSTHQLKFKYMIKNDLF
jgi:uroporphyrinogen-III synthase